MEVNLLLASRDNGAGCAVFFVVMTIVVLVALFKKGKRKGNLQAAAERFQGAVVPSFWSGDRVEFAVDGVPAEVTYHAGSKNRSSFTRIRFQFTPPGYLRLVPEGLFTSLRKAFGAQDIEFGEPGFDKSFLVQGSPEAWVREILDGDTRRRITRLAEMGASFWRGAHVNIDGGPGGVTIFCHRNFVDDRSRLDTFLDEAVAIFRHLRTPVTEGITILSAEEHAGRGECPVCASALDASPHRCPTCGTPHHHDCWEYFGGCAIYGCARRGGR